MWYDLMEIIRDRIHQQRIAHRFWNPQIGDWVMNAWCWLALLVGGLLMPVSLYAEDPPIELGAVNWGRDLEAAKKTSAKTGKPIMVLFQEVPG